jgi:hypothetical protein
LLVDEHGVPVADIRESGGACHDGLGLDRRFCAKHGRDLVRVRQPVSRSTPATGIRTSMSEIAMSAVQAA